MKISVITLHAVKNYGSALQSYATQKIFEDLGLETEIIDYRRKPVLYKTPMQILKSKEYSFKKKIKALLMAPSGKKAKQVFDRFLNAHIKMTDTVYTYDKDFEEKPIQADIYCTGSDQVWNSGWHNGIAYPFFLSFAPDDKKKIAFSASIGKEQLDEGEKAETKRLLERYSAISVREASAVGIIKDLGIENVVQVLDPTLTVTPEVWYDLADKAKRKEKYVLVYQLCNNSKFERYAKRFARKKKLKLIRLCTRYDQMRKPGHAVVLPEIITFLSLFRDAEYVLTDSFHATSFSLIFHKKFGCFWPSAFATRLQSILQLTGLESRHVADVNDFNCLDGEIDYDKVDEILNKSREQTMQFLKNAVCLDK